MIQNHWPVAMNIVRRVCRPLWRPATVWDGQTGWQLGFRVDLGCAGDAGDGLRKVDSLGSWCRDVGLVCTGGSNTGVRVNRRNTEQAQDSRLGSRVFNQERRQVLLSDDRQLRVCATDIAFPVRVLRRVRRC